ncbi:unnamed protein product [Prunus armeniaca]
MTNHGYDSSSSDETGANIMFLEMFENYQKKKAAKKKEKALMVVHGEQIVPFNDYFKQKPDAIEKLSFSPQVKMTAALRMLTYGMATDLNDDYLKIVETTSFEACKRFLSCSQPLIRSLDSMHWVWKNCPMSHHGAYTGYHGYPTIILKAVAPYDTWIWHANFIIPRVFNYLNLLYKSPFFDDVIQGRASQVRYYLNGKQYKQGTQEAYRKDVERAFGILQVRFAVVARPAFQWYREDIWEVLKTCIILHKMIIEDECDQDDITPAEDTPYHVEEALVQHEHG